MQENAGVAALDLSDVLTRKDVGLRVPAVTLSSV